MKLYNRKGILTWKIMLSVSKHDLHIYFRMSRSNSSMEVNEGGIFSKTLDWKSLFLLKIKIKQSSGCPNSEYNAIFKHVNQNIRAYPRSKRKSELIKDSENIFAYWKESKKSEMLANKLGLFQTQLGGLTINCILLSLLCDCDWKTLLTINKIWN